MSNNEQIVSRLVDQCWLNKYYKSWQRLLMVATWRTFCVYSPVHKGKLRGLEFVFNRKIDRLDYYSHFQKRICDQEKVNHGVFVFNNSMSSLLIRHLSLHFQRGSVFQNVGNTYPSYCQTSPFTSDETEALKDWTSHSWLLHKLWEENSPNS